MNTFHLYIYFPQDLDNYFSNTEDAAVFLKKMQMTLVRADCEKGTNLYYTNSNKESFVEEANAMEALIGYFGIASFEEAINYLLVTSNGNNWEQNPLHDVEETYSFYRQWISANRNISEIVPSTLKEITEKKFLIREIHDEKCLLINILNYFPAKNPIEMIKGQYEKNSIIFQIEFVANFDELDHWFLSNREFRNYNLNDNRHIENHPSYINEKSPLLGGLGGKINATSLLQDAIGDPNEKRYLINFDDECDSYIRFEYENDPQNSYHGYHLVIPITHERDIKEEEDIPERIKNILNYRRGIE